MAGEKVGGGDGYAMQVAGPTPPAEVADTPRFIGNFECWSKGDDGIPVIAWREDFKNIVVNQGRNHILNVVFAADRASTNGPFAFLHNATLGSGNRWQDISASQLTSLAQGATSTNFATISFPTTYKGASDTGINSLSQSVSWQILSGPQTVSGAGLMFYTSASCATNCNTTDLRLYCYGSFAATQQLVAGNSLSATITVSFSSA